MTRKKRIGLTLALTYILFLPYDNDYTTDWGNGVVIVADRYVKSGEWVYNCARWHLVSKTPRPFPTEHFMKSKYIKIDYDKSSPKERDTAKDFINDTLKKENWHESLHYVDTYIDESS
jgi:hypothetical protein